MADTWVISDTHFRHASLLNFRGHDGNLVRGNLFDSIDQHDEYMIDQWNRYVKPGDTVYHLGDVFFGDREWFENNWPRLNGIKHLIAGNHDNLDYLVSGEFFETVSVWKFFPSLKMVFTHIPVQEKSAMMWGSKETGLRKEPIQMLNVHGHIHENPSPPGPYRCVSVEQIDYTPINIEELRIE